MSTPAKKADKGARSHAQGKKAQMTYDPKDRTWIAHIEYKPPAWNEYDLDCQTDFGRKTFVFRHRERKPVTTQTQKHFGNYRLVRVIYDNTKWTYQEACRDVLSLVSDPFKKAQVLNQVKKWERDKG